MSLSQSPALITPGRILVGESATTGSPSEGNGEATAGGFGSSTSAIGNRERTVVSSRGAGRGVPLSSGDDGGKKSGDEAPVS